MKYVSTRGQSPALSFSEILLGGLAPDGGLYLPESYPHFSAADLAARRNMDYRQLAFAILSRLADDIPAADLKTLVDIALAPPAALNSLGYRHYDRLAEQRAMPR